MQSQERLEILWRQSAEFRDVLSDGVRNYWWDLNSWAKQAAMENKEWGNTSYWRKNLSI